METAEIKNKEELEQFRLALLSRKGMISELFEAFKQVPGPEKKL